MRRVLRRLAYLLRRRRSDADLAEEMAFHRSMAERDAAAGGATATEARLVVSRSFGSSMLARDRVRDVWIPPLLQDMSGDVRLAARLLRKDVGFSFAAAIAR